MADIYRAKIIGGRYRGKKIALPPVDSTRSSKARLKESLFNTLQFDISGAYFVEMFAGSGSVGLEALSRGAEKIYFLEKNKTALKTLKKNIASMDESRCEVFFGDSFEHIKSVRTMLENAGQKAYFYIDPPFSIREGMDDIYDKVIASIEALPAKVVHTVIIEHMTSVEFGQEIGPFVLQKSKKFGKTTLSYYK
ncbi:MAG: 16S rRNA (guanine(966)-N(2))-methyltransferase RsmD [Campylobacterota bacterium]